MSSHWKLIDLFQVYSSDSNKGICKSALCRDGQFCPVPIRDVQTHT